MRKLHQTIKKVGEDIPRLSYNTAIAAMMEYMNTLRAGERVPRIATRCAPLVQLVEPVRAAHRRGAVGACSARRAASSTPAGRATTRRWSAEDSVTMAVQVNGKTRGTIRCPKTASQDEAMAAAMAEPNVAKFVTGAAKRVIFVPGRMLNVLV